MCLAAGSAVKKLASEMAGRPVVFLEYWAGASVGNRESRCVAAFGSYGYSVPAVMVGSGYWFSEGPVDYTSVFRSMIQADQARPPQAEIEAFWRQVGGTTMRLYATFHNASGVTLDSASNEAAVWGLAWEQNASLGVTGMYTRAAVRSPLAAPVPPDGTGSAVVDLPILQSVDWSRLSAVVALEIRPGGSSGRYDMLQAAVPQAARLSLQPPALTLAVPQGPGAAEILFAGPHVLSWSVEEASPWLVVTPAGGALDVPARVEARADLLQAGEQSGSVTFVASSPDGMSFTATVTVRATYDPDWRRPRRLPRRKLDRASPAETPR